MDGVAIHYRVAGAQHTGTTVVFVHGFGCDSRHFDNAMAHAAERRRAVSIDLPGHGRSGKDRVNWTMEAFGSDVRSVCDAIGAQQIVLVGHSMGGPVVLEAAHEMPGRVSALVPIDTFHDVEQPYTPEQVAGLLDLWRTDYKGSAERMVRKSFYAPNRNPALVDFVTAQVTSLPREIGLPLLDSMLRYDAAASLDTTTLPIRCINSSERQPTNLEAGRRHAKRFDARLVASVGHYPMLEDPAAFNALLDAACDELAGGY